jgi:hypothetical protein
MTALKSAVEYPMKWFQAEGEVYDLSRQNLVMESRSRNMRTWSGWFFTGKSCFPNSEPSFFLKKTKSNFASGSMLFMGSFVLEEL